MLVVCPSWVKFSTPICGLTHCLTRVFPFISCSNLNQPLSLPHVSDGLNLGITDYFNSSETHFMNTLESADCSNTSTHIPKHSQCLDSLLHLRFSCLPHDWCETSVLMLLAPKLARSSLMIKLLTFQIPKVNQ